MTAVNVFVDQDKIHIFSDGGHYIEEDVVHFGAKVLPLPLYNAVLAWSGPSESMLHIWGAINASKVHSIVDLVNILPQLCKEFGPAEKFTAIVVGFIDSMPIGVVVEEDDKVAFLHMGASVLSIPCDIPFISDNAVNSGLEIMESQRLVCPVISGFCIYDLMTAELHTSKVIRRWN